MTGALLRYRVMAWVTGVFLLILTIWAIAGYTVLGYGDGGQKPALYSLMWTGHGWLYFIYLITAVDLTFRMRWSPVATILILLAGTIPLASFFAEHWVTKKVRSQLATLTDPTAPTASPVDQIKPSM
jgi:integral membrane protein